MVMAVSKKKTEEEVGKCDGREDVRYVDRMLIGFFFFKQKTAYEIGTGDWSSDVCSSDLLKNMKLHHMDYDPNMSF